MFSYQPNLFSPSEVVTKERYTELLLADDVRSRIAAIRQLRAEVRQLQVLISANPAPSTMNDGLQADIKQKQQQADSLKRQLPFFMFQATFDESVSKSGKRGCWRKQASARLNGLFIIDVDHIEDPRATFARWIDDYVNINAEAASLDRPSQQRAWAASLGVMLVHVTSSGQGLRVVAKADVEVGNIADNQLDLSRRLGVEADAACKDAARASFCFTFEDQLFINQDIFDYENPRFNEVYGPLYRQGRSGSTHGGTLRSNIDAGRRAGSADPAGSEAAGVGRTEGRAVSGETQPVGAAADGMLNYHGISYEDIINKWFETICGGQPKAGDRHRNLLRLATHLRYITDNDPHLLATVLKESAVGREIVAERGEREIDDIASSACSRQQYTVIPRRLQEVLAAAGLPSDSTEGEGGIALPQAIDYAMWWRRLEPLLQTSPGLREAVAELPDLHKLGGVLAAGAMLGTYLTRCWWEHFDGKEYRLSFLVYIIGDAASGKSFVTRMDRLLMEPMKSADKIGREWERQYKEDMKKRAASSKNARSEAPEQQHPVIRYVPSTISNAMLYRRLTDAVDDKVMDYDQQPIHLHCFTCEAELATALRAQQGSWAGKLDLECKSFQNEEAGVDYANDQSVNGIIQVNWNQVITGTPDALRRKIRPATVLDGLVTRLCIFPMPSNDYTMIERGRAARNHERDTRLRQLGLKLEQWNGCFKGIDRLVDFCYDYERQLTSVARLEQDRCLDYFRKRIPLIMMRYALVRMVLRHVDEPFTAPQLDVTQDDLDFAKLIGDFVLTAQMHVFGQQVMDALDASLRDFQPKRRSTKVRDAYNSLPEVFTKEDVMQVLNLKNADSTRVTLNRWKADGLIEKKDGKYKKIIKTIDTCN